MFFRLKRYKDFVGQVDYYNKYILRSYVKSRFSSFLRSNYIQMQKSRDFCWEIKKISFFNAYHMRNTHAKIKSLCNGEIRDRTSTPGYNKTKCLISLMTRKRKERVGTRIYVPVCVEAGDIAT